MLRVKNQLRSSGGRFFYCNVKGDADEKNIEGEKGDAKQPDADAEQAKNEDDNANAKKGDGKEISVPLYKYRNLKEKFDKVSQEVEKITKQKAVEEENKLKEDGKLKELLETKEQDLASLQEQLEQFKGKTRKTQVNMLVREAVMKASPKDIDVVLPLIKVNDDNIEDDDDGEVASIKGLTEQIEALKKDKDYLFGTPKKNDTKDEDENNRQGAGDINSLEAEYRQLLEKEQLTIAERNRLREVTVKIKNLRKETNNK